MIFFLNLYFNKYNYYQKRKLIVRILFYFSIILFISCNILFSYENSSPGIFRITGVLIVLSICIIIANLFRKYQKRKIHTYLLIIAIFPLIKSIFILFGLRRDVSNFIILEKLVYFSSAILIAWCCIEYFCSIYKRRKTINTKVP